MKKNNFNRTLKKKKIFYGGTISPEIMQKIAKLDGKYVKYGDETTGFFTKVQDDDEVSLFISNNISNFLIKSEQIEEEIKKIEIFNDYLGSIIEYKGEKGILEKKDNGEYYLLTDKSDDIRIENIDEVIRNNYDKNVNMYSINFDSDTKFNTRKDLFNLQKKKITHGQRLIQIKKLKEI